MNIDFVEIENVRRLARVIDTLTRADEGEPRIGLVTGGVGLGKSSAIDEAYINRGCLCVRACATWTPNGMLKAILKKGGLEGTTAAVHNLERAVDMLKARNKGTNPARSLLIIDEADYLLSRASQALPPVILDTVRDLHDLSRTPVLLAGEPDLLATLERNSRYSDKYKRFWDRVLISEEFQPLTAGEIKVMAERLTGLSMPDESAQELRESQEGNVRLVIIALKVAERMAKGNRIQALPLELVKKAEEKAAKTKRYYDSKKRIPRRAA